MVIRIYKTIDMRWEYPGLQKSAQQDTRETIASRVYHYIFKFRKLNFLGVSS